VQVKLRPAEESATIEILVSVIMTMEIDFHQGSVGVRKEHNSKLSNARSELITHANDTSHTTEINNKLE